MIINVRGTSGSGKTHLVRNLMECYDSRIKVYDVGRRQPIGYVCERANGPSLSVIGHYEIACGGCDTISTMDQIFELVRESHQEGHDVIFEGLLVNSDRNRTVQMHEDGLPLLVVTLSTPIELCLESVMARREAKAKKKGDGNKAKELNPRNTESRFKMADKNDDVFKSLEMPSCYVDRETAALVIEKALDL